MTEDAGEAVVLLEKQDHIGWITLNRPAALNALTQEVQDLLAQHVRHCGEDPEIRVLVVRGAGERAFCAGADIKGFQAAQSPVLRRQQRLRDHWIGALDDCQKPIVASIHGHCLGGGLEIALACDIRIATEDAKLGFPETGLGIIPAAGGTQRAVRALGWSLALDLVLTGRRISGVEAHRIGLVTRLATAADLAARTLELAQGLAAKPPLAVQFAKEAVRRGFEMEFAAGRRLETDLYTHLFNTEDRLEAARAFSEKRPPKFTGR